LFDEGLLKDLPAATMQKLRRLAGLLLQWGVELNQLALAYTLTIPGMGAVIPSSSSVSQLESNAAAGRLVLTAEQQEQIRAALTPTATEDK
jgi:aryl-alcohol dehydrogenase-like predicted oxidoreductase